MTKGDWTRRDELFVDWQKADDRLMAAVMADPLPTSSLERIYQDERRAMTQLAEFDRRMGLRPLSDGLRAARSAVA